MIKNKTAIAIAMLLMLSIAFPFAAFTGANAQSDYVYVKKTYAVIGAMPNPVGAGQEVLIWLGITDYLRTVTNGWEGLTVTVTKPDNTTETLGPYRTDSTGSTGAVYTPTMVGTYYLQSHFPEQNFTWDATSRAPIIGNVLYQSSSSRKMELIVTDEQVQPYPGSPLPIEYWTRPINAQHREWSTISGNWVTTPDQQIAVGNDDAPESAHILWSKPLAMGGLAGGELGDHAFECGDAYEGFFSGSVIIGGVLFYNQFNANGGTRVEKEVVAVDLHTGEELWVRNWNNSRLSFGQVFYWDSYNYHAAFEYLWSTSGSTWNAYDAFSGRWEFSMKDVPSGSTVRGPKGEIFIYTINLERGWMTLWNSSRVVSDRGSWLRNNMGRELDATRGIEWNKTIPTGLPGVVNKVFYEDRILGSTVEASAWQNVGDEPIQMWCLSLKPGQEGLLMWQNSWQPPPGDLTINDDASSVEEGVFVISAKEVRQHWGFSLNTGEKLWGPTASESDLGIFGLTANIAYGKLYVSARMAGVLYCYDVKTGELLWTYEAKDPFNEILWSNFWPIRPDLIADGKIYLAHSEHSPVDPKPRGAPFICLDAETGEEVWKIDGGFRVTDWGGRSIIGDSIIATYDSYDQLVYAIGKGPSSTSAIIRSDTLTLGNSVLIQGMVTDVSPGTRDAGLMMRFPNGVPAVSDASMSEWMKYVYMQFQRPTEVTGVEVTISVVDSNGNYRNIGTAVSDASGFYSLQWTPDIEGKYTVIVSFEGSESYWPSQAETAFAVDPAVEAPSSSSIVENTSLADQFFLPAVSGLAVIIIVIGALLAMLLLKKKQ